MPYEQAGFRLDVDVSAEGCVISIFGEVDVASAPAVGQALQEAEVSAATSVILDLAGVSFVDSAGIRVLMDAVLASRAGQNKLSIRRDYQPQVDRILTLVGVIETLPYLATAYGSHRA
jgi:anti-sigma B factor antagonist